MPFDLAAALPLLLPRAIAWVEAQEAQVLRTGKGLSTEGADLARSVGVRRPERIRVSLVDQIPLPDDDPELREAALEAGLIGPDTRGITFGYAIYIRSDLDEPGLLWHECRHVHQYEVAGSIAAFLQVYLQQIVEFGYDRAPLEVDARNHERDAP